MLPISKAAVALCAIGFALMAAPEGKMHGHGPIPSPDGPDYGVYDPARDFRNESYVGIEGFFFPWMGSDLAWLGNIDDYASARGRTVLLTLEPFSWSATKQQQPQQLRKDILAGRYDARMQEICGVIDGMRSPVWVRWGHEMDGPSDRYPWAGWAPGNYIAAYRHFVTQCRKAAPGAKYVWSPKGVRSAAAYFPGKAYVDIVGVSFYGLQAYQRLTGAGGDRGFTESFRPVYERLAAFGLPMIIAELGYSGDVNYVNRWSEEAFRHDQFPGLKAIVYFNAKETGSWPLGLGRPDWRVYANITQDRSH